MRRIATQTIRMLPCLLALPLALSACAKSARSDGPSSGYDTAPESRKPSPALNPVSTGADPSTTRSNAGGPAGSTGTGSTAGSAAGGAGNAGGGMGGTGTSTGSQNAGSTAADARNPSAGTDANVAAATPPNQGKKRACTTDQDCKLHSNYCNGCSCIALVGDEAAPTCKDKVACLRDPCQGQKAVCRSGKCEASGGKGSEH